MHQEPIHKSLSYALQTEGIPMYWPREYICYVTASQSVSRTCLRSNQATNNGSSAAPTTASCRLGHYRCAISRKNFEPRLQADVPNPLPFLYQILSIPRNRSTLCERYGASFNANADFSLRKITTMRSYDALPASVALESSESPAIKGRAGPLRAA
jgi:hypothetical protein